jgi:DNA-binding NtrC family response regulator
VKEWKPKVVLLDMIMPRTEGSDVLKEIRKADPAIGVVIVTVVTDNLKASKSFELGAYDSVTKPVDLITRKR